MSGKNQCREVRAHEKSQQLGPGQEGYFRIWQDRASPFSYKVMAYMNYKGIPYKRIQANAQATMQGIPKLVGQSIIPVVLTPEEEVLQDSTPIIEWFEQRYVDRAVIPQDQRLACFMWLLEDFADEYMPRIHMHTRWGNKQNRRAVSHRIARGQCYAMPQLDVSQVATMVVARQPGFDKHLGLTDAVRSNMDEQVLELLSILEAHFLDYQFLFGYRPSLADFALYGSLFVHLYNDPNSRETMEVHGPRTCAWLETIHDFGDTRGGAGQTEFGDWLNLDEGVPETLQRLLGFTAKTYVPFARSCAQASQAGEKRFEAEVYGMTASFSTHHYRAWSFEQVQKRYAALEGTAKTFVDDIFSQCGVLPELMADGIAHCDLFDGFTPPVIKDGVSDARVRHMKSKGKKAGLL